jgi:hypothetical protein
VVSVVCSLNQVRVWGSTPPLGPACVGCDGRDCERGSGQSSECLGINQCCLQLCCCCVPNGLPTGTTAQHSTAQHSTCIEQHSATQIQQQQQQQQPLTHLYGLQTLHVPPATVPMCMHAPPCSGRRANPPWPVPRQLHPTLEIPSQSQLCEVTVTVT